MPKRKNTYQKDESKTLPKIDSRGYVEEPGSRSPTPRDHQNRSNRRHEMLPPQRPKGPFTYDTDDDDDLTASNQMTLRSTRSRAAAIEQMRIYADPEDAEYDDVDMNSDTDTAPTHDNSNFTPRATRRSSAAAHTSYRRPMRQTARGVREESGLFVTPAPQNTPNSSMAMAMSTLATGPQSSSKPKNYAAEIKERMLAAGRGGFGPHQGRKNSPAKNSENIMIKELRQHQRMAWDEIAKELNEQRVANGQQPGLTAASCYGRFVRNAPLIAEMNGEVDFDIQDHMHLQEHRKRAKHAGPAVDRARSEGPMPVFDEEDDRKLCEAVEAVDNKRWELIVAEFKKNGGFHITPIQAAKRFKMI